MSRGPGKIERAIARAIRRSRSRLGRVQVEVEDIAFDVYDADLDAASDAAIYAARVDKATINATRIDNTYLDDAEIDAAIDAAYDNFPTKAQRVAVLRAMHTFVRKHRAYALAGGKGVTPLRIVNMAAR